METELKISRFVKMREIWRCMAPSRRILLLQTIIGTRRLTSRYAQIVWQYELSEGTQPDWVLYHKKPVTIGSLSPADMLRYFSSVFGTTEIHILDILHLNLKEKKAVRRRHYRPSR